MKINGISQTIIGIYKDKIPAGRIIRKYAPAGDIVSFSGKNKSAGKEKHISSNVSKAVELADKLTQIPTETPFSLKLISSIMAQDSADISLRPIEELADVIDDSQNYGAYYSGILTQDFNISDVVIYLNTSKADIDSAKRLSVIQDTAHEYTHALQMQEGTVTEFLKTVTKGNYQYAKALQGLGIMAFKPLDNDIQAQAVMKVFRNYENMCALKKYGFLYPREQKVSKQDIFDSLGVKNEQEFKTFILKQFDNSFEYNLCTLLSDPEVSAMIPEKNYNKIRNKVKTYCQMYALREKEAYTSESIVAKKYLKTDKSINLDIFPIYYSMVADALK